MRITTFNCENLFGRYGFMDRPSSTPDATNDVDYSELIKVVDVGSLAKGKRGKEPLAPKAISDKQRKNTGDAILAAAPDVLCVNEVENLDVLRLFNARFLQNTFDRIVLIKGNDMRGINVGLLVRREAKVEIEGFQSHADDAIAGGYLTSSNRLDTKVLSAAVFSRDNLSVNMMVGGLAVTLMLNHLKAQAYQGGKDTTTKRRREQAEHVATLVDAVHKDKRLPIVLGDFNKDSLASDYDGSLDPLLKHAALYDPFPEKVAPSELWSHYYTGDRKTSRLDYILIDKALARKVSGVEFFRGGLTPKCTQYTGPRLNSLKDGEEASDHCPTTLVLND